MIITIVNFTQKKKKKKNKKNKNKNKNQRQNLIPSVEHGFGNREK